MGGTNPYIEPSRAALPARPFRITFLPAGITFEADPARFPYGSHGLPGSILDLACGAGDIGIDHACGGVCACSTCHVIVREGLDSCGETSEAEADQLDNAPGVTPRSRLACQTVPDGSRDLVVEVPGWNRNAVREPHG